MWITGAGRRGRRGALADMLAAAGRTERYDEPWRAWPQVWEFFTDEGDVLRELQSTWRTDLAGAVYVAIETGRGDLAHDVLEAFTRVERRHQTLRRILEAHREHPSISAAMRKERSLLSGFVASLSADPEPVTAA